MKILSLILAAALPLASMPSFADESSAQKTYMQEGDLTKLLAAMNEANLEMYGIYAEYVAARALIFAVKYGRFVKDNSPLSFKSDTTQKERILISVPLGAVSLLGIHVGSRSVKDRVVGSMPSRSALREWQADFANAQLRTEAMQTALNKAEALNEVGSAEIETAMSDLKAAEAAEANLLTIQPSSAAPVLKRLGVKSIYGLGLFAVYYTAVSQIATLSVDANVLTNLPDIQARAEQDRLALKAAGFNVPGFIDYIPGFMK